MKTTKSYLVATDVGGTCTDTVVFAIGEPVILGKALSTPPDCTRLRIETGKSGRIAFKRFCPSRASAWSCERDVAPSRICVTDCVLPRMTKLDFGTAL